MLKAFAAACAAFALATPASAAVVLATFEGVATGTAVSGLFGDATSFQNVAFRAVLTIDDELGTLTFGPTQDILQGSGAEAPVTDGYIEIAGVRREIFPTSAFLMAQKLTPRVIYTLSQQGGGANTNLTLRSALPAPLGGFAAPTSSLLGGTGGAFTSVAGGQVQANFQLKTISFSIAPPPPPPTPVPEPGAWALMIVGFGGAGAWLRRRRALLAA